MGANRLLSQPSKHARKWVSCRAHYEGNGAIIFKLACALGCEGIVSKRRGSPHRGGRSDHWVKIKNPNAPAVRRLEQRSGTELPHVAHHFG